MQMGRSADVAFDGLSGLTWQRQLLLLKVMKIQPLVRHLVPDDSL